jgi:hypothetical protein
LQGVWNKFLGDATSSVNYCLDDLGIFGVDESIMIVVGFTLPLASQGCNAYLSTPDSFILKVRTDTGSIISF